MDTRDGQAPRFRTLRAVAAKKVLGETMIPKTITGFENLLEDLPKIVEKVGIYCIHNCGISARMSESNLPCTIGFKLGLVGTFGEGMDITEDMLPGGSRAHEVADRFGVTPQGLAAALCTRGGTVCGGTKCSALDPKTGKAVGHKIHIPTIAEATASNSDFYMPVLLGVKRVVYEADPEASFDQIQQTTNAIFDARDGSNDNRGRYLFNLVSEGSLNSENGGIMYLANEDWEDFVVVSSFLLPRVVGSRGTGVDPMNGGYLISSGARKQVRNVLRGVTEQIFTQSVHGGSKASVRVHRKDDDPLRNRAIYITDSRRTTKSGKKVAVHALEDDQTSFSDIERSARESWDDDIKNKCGTGMWFGSTWFKVAIPLPLLLISLGIEDAQTILALCGASATDHVQQISAITCSYYAAMRMLACDPNTPSEYSICDQARIFIVREAFRTFKHDKEILENDQDRLDFFYSRVVPTIVFGVDDYNSTSRLATLQYMAIRVVSCTRTALRGKLDTITRDKTAHFPDDRDHVGMKRVYGIGDFMAQLIQTKLMQALKTQVLKTEKRMKKVKWNWRSVSENPKNWTLGEVTNGLRHFYRTGQVAIGRHSDVISGVVVTTGDKSKLDTFCGSHVVVKSLGEAALDKPRQLPPSSFGFICPIKTPEGKKIGDVNSFASGASVTPEPTDELIREIADFLYQSNTFMSFGRLVVFDKHRRMLVSAVEGGRIYKTPDDELDTPGVKIRGLTRPDLASGLLSTADGSIAPVILNHTVIGFTAAEDHMMYELREHRRGNSGWKNVSFVKYHDSVTIQVSSRRLIRPLFSVTPDSKLKVSKRVTDLAGGSFEDLEDISLDSLYEDGTVVYISALEQECVNITFTREYDNTLTSTDREPPADPFSTEFPTHAEIHPLLMLGPEGMSIAHVNRSPAPRGVYHAQHFNHAMGMPDDDLFTTARYSTRKAKYEGQRRLVASAADGFTPARTAPATENMFVAIVATPQTGEDARTIATASKDRGSLRKFVTVQVTETFTSIVPDPEYDSPGTVILGYPGMEGDTGAVEQVILGHTIPRGCSFFQRRADADSILQESRCASDDDDDDDDHTFYEYDGLVRAQNFNYSKLQSDGLVAPGTSVSYGDVIMGRITVVPEVNEDGTHRTVYRDSSILYEKRVSGKVQTVSLTNNEAGEIVVHIDIKQLLPLTVGDKVSCDTGQKGVIEGFVSIDDNCFVYAPGNPEYDGIPIQMFINVHSIISRMTLALFVGMTQSHLCAKRGEFARGTPFSGTGIDDYSIFDKLENEVGINRFAEFSLMDGTMGTLFGEYSKVFYENEKGETVSYTKVTPRKFFCGWVAVVAQPHLAIPKCRSVTRAPIDPLTHQPKKGNDEVDGGNRIGTMEKDCLIAHGVASMLRDRLLLCSDAAKIPVCGTCGSISLDRTRGGVDGCTRCGTKAEIDFVTMPYAAKLLIQELTSMGLKASLETHSVGSSLRGQGWVFGEEEEEGKEVEMDTDVVTPTVCGPFGGLSLSDFIDKIAPAPATSKGKEVLPNQICVS